MVPEPAQAAADPGLVGAVVAVKDLSRAKSRMTTLPAALRGRLASLMAVTVTAALTDVVDHVVLVTTAPGLGPLLDEYGLSAPVVADPRGGLNAAFESGENALRATGCDLIVACMADLPALNADAVRAALAACTGTGRWFVRDAVGTGTTLLAARGTPLAPAFGPGSAQRHAGSGAREVVADDRLRLDADNADDLTRAIALGVSPPVTALVDQGALGAYTTGTVAGLSPEGRWPIVTAAGTRAYAEPAALGAELRRLAPGQRVHLVHSADGTVRHVWI